LEGTCGDGGGDGTNHESIRNWPNCRKPAHKKARREGRAWGIFSRVQ